ncbi:DUF4178 domain-containing protein [bacterium]|nr:DUF4178 domain-containing protein [bacterium]
MQAQCPSCGNFINYKSAQSAYVVCSACQTLVARKDVNVEAVGKVAALQPDGSLLRVGTQGVFRNLSFEIVGRIQVALGPVKEPDVIWNEWHATFSNGSSGWVGEARGEYLVSFSESVPHPPAADDLRVGMALGLGSETAVVSSVTTGTALSFEGELPFIMDTSYQAVFADLSTISGLAGTLDYSEDPPLLFKGQWCTFEELKLRGLRGADEEGEGPRLAASNLKSLKCPTCGAPHELQAGGISQTLVCAFCDSAMDLSQDATFKTVLQFEQKMSKVPAKIPLGSKGILPGGAGEFTCIGYMSRSCRVEGVTYRWCEYLLYEPTRGYRWLTDSNGHWTLLHPLHQVPSNASGQPVGYPPNSEIRLEKSTYKHFQKTLARVEYVAGEFYWRVRIGETSEVNDYVNPPLLLSADVLPGEINWSAGTYVTGDQLWQAFKLPGSPAAPVGVANNQPNPYKAGSNRRWMNYFLAVACCFAFLLMREITTPKPFFEKDWSYKDYQVDRVELVPVTVPAGSHNLYVKVKAPSLKQRWGFFLISLINEKTQEVHDTAVTLYQESGSDSDGAWSEGVLDAGVSLAHVAGGNYVLRIEPQSNISGKDTPEGAGAPVSYPSERFRYYVQIERDHAQWGYFWALVLLGLLPALWSSWRSSSFETSRWSESDHSPVSSDDDE